MMRSHARVRYPGHGRSPSLDNQKRQVLRQGVADSGLSGYLAKVEGQAVPKAILRPLYGKSRLPAMSEGLPSFT